MVLLWFSVAGYGSRGRPAGDESADGQDPGGGHQDEEIQGSFYPVSS